MIVCPVCENAQAAGGDCEVCGRPLARAGSPGGPMAAPPVATVEGLEPTAHERVHVRVESLDDLEPTLRPPVDEVPGDALDLEAGRAAPVDVDAPALPDLERSDDGIPGDDPTPLPALATCRYCRTPAMPGERICARCGMRLPLVDGPRATPAGDPERRCGCGALVASGDRPCPSCGARPAAR
jgi:hypothetical protein